MEKITKNFVREVIQKSQDDSLDSPVKIGVTFDDVVDTRANKSYYSLAQFYDNYESFIKNNKFVYAGDSKPANSHIAFWIDTSVTNQDDSILKPQE